MDIFIGLVENEAKRENEASLPHTDLQVHSDDQQLLLTSPVMALSEPKNIAHHWHFYISIFTYLMTMEYGTFYSSLILFIYISISLF